MNSSNSPITNIEGMKTSLSIMNGYPYSMAILLDHKYTQRSIETNGIKALKGIDNDRFKLLSNANEQLPVDKQYVFYIAHANLVVESYEVTGYYEQGYDYRYEMDEEMSDEMSDEDCNPNDYRPKGPEWEENERSVSIENIYNLNGVKKFENAAVELDVFDKFINPSEMDDVDLNCSDAWGDEFEEDIDGWCGNEGMNRTLTYEKHLLVCWPKKFEFDILLSIDNKSAVEVLQNLLNDKSAEDPLYLQRLERSIDALNEDSSNFIVTCSKIITILMEVINEEHTKRIFAKIMICHYSDKALSKKLAVLLNNFDCETAKRILKSISTNKTQNNIYLINGLLEINDKTIAEFYFNESIVPILETKPKYESCLSDLLYIIFKFTKNQSVNLSNFVQLAIKSENPISEPLIEHLVKNYPSQASSKPLLDLVMSRVNYLLEKTKSKPSYCLDIRDQGLTSFPQLVGFLNSDKEIMVFSDIFKRARDKMMLQRIETENNLRINIRGSGKNTIVEVDKRALKPKISEWNKHKAELNKIKKSLNLKIVQ